MPIRVTGGNGIYIGLGASGNVIGGCSPADRNIISGNNQSGILISGAGTDTNTVSGNYIGVNAGGGASLRQLVGTASALAGAPSTTGSAVIPKRSGMSFREMRRPAFGWRGPKRTVM